MSLEKNESSEINANKLKCPIDKSVTDLFFSLVDYRNNLFMSKDPDKIIGFYNSFENRDHLIKWMKERPKGVSYIHEVEGDKDIIVVIPTADFNGKFAKTCRDEIFKGLHIVFVESGVGNYYFNYAHNCNVGIKKAMEYNPKWIVISNDDMYKIDDATVLKRELSSLGNISVQIVFVSSTNYHSYPAMLSIPRLGRYILFSFLGKVRRYQLMLEKKYKVKYFLPPKKGLYNLFFKKGIPVQAIGNFGILSMTFLKNIEGNLFDENYINGAEDIDLAIRVTMEKINYSLITFRIGDYLGSSLGKNTPEGLSNLRGTPRRLRDVANMTYFNYKIDHRKFHF